jgi:uncharacterized protein
VAIQEVVSRVENAAKVSVIILDACRDSPLQERLRRIAAEKNRAAVPPKGLPPVSVVGSNTLIVYATVPGETASDGKGRNSPFTASLLRNIETPGLEIELMFKRVTADVLSATGGKQQPERLSRLQNELMLIPQAQNVVAEIGKLSAAPSAPMGEAAQAWNEIKDLKDAAVFEAYRKQYGPRNALYDTLASQKISELSKADAEAMAECDRLAASPDDDKRWGEGVVFEKLDAVRAISVCEPVAIRTSSPRAMYLLGRALDKKGDYSKARDWYEKAIAKGNAAAMNNIGTLYDNGQGVAQDYAKARAWYEKAAAKGYAAAMNNIGTLYDNGQGVAQDYAKARDWYERSAAKGNAQAMINLGDLYRDGHSVTRDPAKARSWYEKAQSLGDQAAGDRLAKLAHP